MKAKWDRSIWALMGFKAASRFLVLMPILIPFLQDKGLSLAQVFQLTGIYSLSCAILEVPTGFIADTFGRKRSLIIGALAFLLAHIGYVFLEDFELLILVNVLLGLAASFFSGTDSSYLYERLLVLDRKDEFNKFEGKLYAISNFSEAAAGLFTALVVGFSLYFTAYVQVFAGLAAMLCLLFIQEVPALDEKPRIKNQLKLIVDLMKSDGKFQSYMLVSSLLGLSTLALSWFSQAFFEQIGLALFWFGILWTGLNLLVGFGSSQSYKLADKFSLYQLSLFSALIISLAFILLGYFMQIWVIAFLALAFFARGIATPALRTLIHERTPSAIRSSIFSIRSLFIRGLYGLVALGIAWSMDSYGFSISLICFGCILFVSFILIWIFQGKAAKT